MKKHGLIFAFSFILALTCSFKAKADIEAIQAVITALGDVYQGFQEQVTKAKSLYESTQQLASQVKSAADEVKSTVEKGKQMYSDAKEKAEAIKSKVQGAVDAIKNRDINALKSGLSNMEFSAFKDTFNGKQDDSEMADTILENLVRKKGNDSIANQKALSKAINQRNGLDIANLFAKSTVMRQKLSDETGSFHNPQSVDEALDLCQKVQLRTMQRQNEISSMENSLARFIHMRAIENVGGSYEEGEKNE